MNFVVHIGFSRTGTTTLQKNLFARHSQLHYLGKPYQSEVFRREIDDLLMHETLEYRAASLDRMMMTIRSGLKNFSPGAMVLSDERLVSYSKVRDRGVVAERIKSHLQPDKILITIRNQFDILKSAYLSRGRLLRNVPDKYLGRFVSFEDWLSFSFDNSDRSYIGHVDYYKTIAYYAKTFGKDNISVLLFEDFVRNKEAFIKKLADILGISSDEALERIGDDHEHKEIGQKQLDFERFKTRIFPAKRNPILGRLVKFCYFGLNPKSRKKDRTAEVQIPSRWKDRPHSFYSDRNRKLAEEYGLPLDKYRYPL